MELFIMRFASSCGLNPLCRINFLIYSLMLIIADVEALAKSLHDEPCLVNAPAGTYRGLTNTSALYSQSKYCQFLGIKYAEALGDHRFGKPIPVQSLGPDEVYDAFSFGNWCLQGQIPGSEDCLSLNVFTQKLYSKVDEPLKAVIVNIHQGAFQVGGSETYGPDYLVPRNVVLVTMNYRLGPFGFLNLNITGCPGNMGLWDQSLALKWVRLNIESFGGDPDRITLSGGSAGATSTYLHILSPQSQGLFQRAIIQSPVMTYKFVKNDTVSKSISFARFLGCPTDVDAGDEILRCLQRKSPDELVKGWQEFYTFLDSFDDTYRSHDPPFWPSEDAWQEQPFLPSTSLEELGKKAPNIEVIIGQSSADAGAYFGQYDNLDVVNEVQSNLHIYLRKVPLFARDERLLQAVTEKVKAYYFNESNLDNKIDETQKKYASLSLNLETFTDPESGDWLLLDLTYDNWYVETIPFLSAAYHNGKIRTYQFQVEDYQIMKKLLFSEDYRLVEGAAHLEELDYLYLLSFASSNLTVTKNQFRVIQEMTMYWTNFAKTGNPNGDGNSETLVQWKPILPTPSKPNYLLIGNETTVFVEGRMIEHERREFWAGLRRFAEQYYYDDYLSKMRLYFKNGPYTDEHEIF